MGSREVRRQSVRPPDGASEIRPDIGQGHQAVDAAVSLARPGFRRAGDVAVARRHQGRCTQPGEQVRRLEIRPTWPSPRSALPAIQSTGARRGETASPTRMVSTATCTRASPRGGAAWPARVRVGAPGVAPAAERGEQAGGRSQTRARGVWRGRWPRLHRRSAGRGRADRGPPARSTPPRPGAGPAQGKLTTLTGTVPDGVVAPVLLITWVMTPLKLSDTLKMSWNSTPVAVGTSNAWEALTAGLVLKKQ
jgi:hypothetical protein